MGIISDFVSGASKGLGEGLDMELKAKLTREMNEANYRRDVSMKRLLAGEEREFRRGESELERKSKEKIASGKPSKVTKIKVIDPATDMEVDALLNPDGTYTIPRQSGSAPTGGRSPEEVDTMVDEAWSTREPVGPDFMRPDAMAEALKLDGKSYKSETEWKNAYRQKINDPSPPTTRSAPTWTQFQAKIKRYAKENNKQYDETKARAKFEQLYDVEAPAKPAKKKAKKKGIIERGKGDVAASSVARQQQSEAESKRTERGSGKAKIREDYQRKFKAMPDSQKRVWWRKNAAALRKSHSKEYREGRKIMEKLTRKRSVSKTFQESRAQ